MIKIKFCKEKRVHSVFTKQFMNIEEAVSWYFSHYPAVRVCNLIEDIGRKSYTIFAKKFNALVRK